MLVIVENWNIERLLQLFLDHETLGRLDVFKIDAAECRFENLASADHLEWIFCVQLDVEHVDIRKSLEEHAFAFHDRLAGQCADITQSQHCRTVADDGNEIAFRSVQVGIGWVLFDFKAGQRHTRCVGERQISLGHARLRRCYLDLAFAPHRVVL